MVTIDWYKHWLRLVNVTQIVNFSSAAIAEFAAAIPKREAFVASRDKMVDAYKRMLSALVDPPAVDDDQLRKQIDDAFIISEPSRQLLYNLGLVMLCTEIEIFVEHIIQGTASLYRGIL